MIPDKFILDACCGGRMFWFDKHHPNALYIDNRSVKAGAQKDNPKFRQYRTKIHGA